MIDLKKYLFEFNHISIPYLEPYYPISYQPDNYSKMIRDLKDNDEFAVEYFYNRLKDYFEKNINTIVIVPSHDPGSHVSGIKSLADKLAKYRRWNDYSDLITREKFIEKLSAGGDRRMRVHRESLKAERIKSILLKKILLIDDVTTTGNSIYACMEILESIGARYIQPFTLAKTINA